MRALSRGHRKRNRGDAGNACDLAVKEGYAAGGESFLFATASRFQGRNCQAAQMTIRCWESAGGGGWTDYWGPFASDFRIRQGTSLSLSPLLPAIAVPAPARPLIRDGPQPARGRFLGE